MNDHGWGRFVPQAYQDRRNDIVPLRFAFSFPDAVQMKDVLKRFLDVEQFWFQSTVIGCPEGAESLGYRAGSCPVAEKVSNEIINWPCVLTDRSKKTFTDLLHKTVGKFK